MKRTFAFPTFSARDDGNEKSENLFAEAQKSL